MVAVLNNRFRITPTAVCKVLGILPSMISEVVDPLVTQSLFLSSQPDVIVIGATALMAFSIVKPMYAQDILSAVSVSSSLLSSIVPPSFEAPGNVRRFSRALPSILDTINSSFFISTPQELVSTEFSNLLFNTEDPLSPRILRAPVPKYIKTTEELVKLRGCSTRGLIPALRYLKC